MTDDAQLLGFGFVMTFLTAVICALCCCFHAPFKKKEEKPGSGLVHTPLCLRVVDAVLT